MSESVVVEESKRKRRVRKPWVDGPLAIYRVDRRSPHPGAAPSEFIDSLDPVAIGEDFASPEEVRAWIEACGTHDTVYECHVRVFRVRTEARTAVVLENEDL